MHILGNKQVFRNLCGIYPKINNFQILNNLRLVIYLRQILTIRLPVSVPLPEVGVCECEVVGAKN